jgi:hypothetical protein
MRFFNLRNNFNWKYVIGEILLIFVGISLAIWFNNWNASTRSDHAKQVAIVKIKEEIRNNIKELAISAESNRRLLDAYEQYTPLFGSTTSTVRTKSKNFAMLQRKYPGFFVLTDSLAITPDEVEYHGGVHIQLELPTLTDIAWETTKSISITNEFSYE